MSVEYEYWILKLLPHLIGRLERANIYCLQLLNIDIFILF